MTSENSSKIESLSREIESLMKEYQEAFSQDLHSLHKGSHSEELANNAKRQELVSQIKERTAMIVQISESES